MCNEISNSDTQWHNTQVPKAHEKKKPKKVGKREREGEEAGKVERGCSARAREGHVMHYFFGIEISL